MTDQPDTNDWPQVAPAEFWEQRYSDSGQIWSGKVNASMASVAEGLTPGRALDLGCGEGGDVIWLASRGWQATGLDIAPSAIRRGQQAAKDAGLEGARFEVADLSGGGADDEWDLVTASFFHSPVSLERTEILRQAAQRVAPGGHLLITSHAAAPPWADEHAKHHHHFLTADEEVQELDLPADEWETELAEVRTREAIGPDGSQATLDDVVVLLKRRAGTDSSI